MVFPSSFTLRPSTAHSDESPPAGSHPSDSFPARARPVWTSYCCRCRQRFFFCDPISSSLCVPPDPHVEKKLPSRLDLCPPDLHADFIWDMLQALGIMLNFIHVQPNHSRSTAELICTSQGLLIELADVASALMYLLISVETFVILSNGPMHRLLCFSTLEPQHAFYAWGGAWCWIGMDYFSYQISFHDVWIWLATATTSILYGILYDKIRTHYKEARLVLRRSSIILPPPETPSTISDFSDSQANRNLTAKQAVGQKGLRAVARTMLLYPILFSLYSCPITIVLLIGEHPRSKWYPTAILVLSTIFALRGVIEVLIFGMTRNVFILRTPPNTMQDDESLSPTSPRSFQKANQPSTALADCDEKNASVCGDFATYTRPEAIELKLPRNYEAVQGSV
ncbi:hypothetical protein O181_012933 [Austropuccinia psidii MF-1]|uniref:G-protein coupled receptors family 1 profile domain-containing protein n=1 Tax=Austropuccinia psidii MF-1 TaxID=1389203 RepID=A0A9Q3BY96_9BASI|nr:hypothetical protein [Austropuccinia psidii MF-1]